MLVEWTQHAQDRLADLYVEADVRDKPAIAAGAEAFTARLADDPWFLGESRETDLRRVWFAYPLVVGYEIIPGNGVVVFYVNGLRPPAAGM
jgi:hypothetical protein